MGAPKFEIIQTTYHNPHASEGLKLNMAVVSNTPQEHLERNIRFSSRKYPDWLSVKEPHNGVAILIAGGWSANEHIEEIKALNGTIIAMNGSAKWCREHGIDPDWQVIVDAKEETSQLVDPETKQYFASQCHPNTLKKANNLTLVHFGLETIEDFLPYERVKKGGYTLLGAGTTVGNAALSIAFSQGYREMHLFGYDSSYHDGNSHAYDQSINRFMPTTEITWNNKTYTASVAMKGQAEKFPLNALALKNAGCDLHVYGDGLLQTIYNTKYEDLTEQEKYQLMWNMPAYRTVAPGEHLVDKFREVVKPDGLVIDFGCGTGRAGLKIAETNEVLLVDFTDNCRDHEAICLPFIQADLTEPLSIHGEYGYCTDVMEHIPTEDVDKVIHNIMNCTPKAFFQISTVDDSMGALIGEPLHLTVQPHDWWKDKFRSLGYEVSWDEEHDIASLLYIQTGDNHVSR